MDTQTLLYPETTPFPWAPNPAKDTAITNLRTAEPSVKNLTSIESRLSRLRTSNPALFPLSNEAFDLSYVAFNWPYPG